MYGRRNIVHSFHRNGILSFKKYSLQPYKRPSSISPSSSSSSSSSSSLLSMIRLFSVNKPDFQKEAEAKYFEFQRLEQDIYQWWEKNGYFQPQDDDNLPHPPLQRKDGEAGNAVGKRLKRKKFVIPMPPPNVTGYLHMGHAIFLALQDIMTRFYRMRGFSTVWIPGTDHAGIATQLLVEKSLLKQGITRQSLGREKFLEKVWEWKQEKGDYIINQMKRLGASADWSKQKFTLDPDMNEAVTEAFIQLFEKGLIYRGSYMVNWSPNLQTAVSDLEVEYAEEEGKLYYFKYPLTDNPEEFIPVATTRPETILGDTAVCVHPEDLRYKHLIGKSVTVPMMNRSIPVIADEYVDREFGTGALKITPGHDINDYEIGQRHSLPAINIFNKDATINGNGHQYEGLDRFVCREQLWKDMTANDLVIKEEKHTQRVPRSQRGGEIIEPMISSQWFVKMDKMAKKAVEAVQKKELQIIPDRFEKIWYNWLENIHDWCISRQLWWGHRIPVYYVKEKSTTAAAAGGRNNDKNSGQETKFVVARSYDEALQKAQSLYGEEITIEQDEDVLDTWFSSGLWPFATVGWPHASSTAPDSDFQKFYPASVLETGYDILFFWVARMVTMGIELTGRIPFHTIYMHGLVRDAQGQKMSKTKGNVIDPIDTIEQFGSDALRFALVTACSPGQDIPLSIERIESYRNFVTKLWNIGKYLQFSSSQYHAALPADYVKPDFTISRLVTEEEIHHFLLPERYIITRLHEVIEQSTEAIEQYRFHEGGRLIYDFIWNEFADWYLEISKFHLRRSASSTTTSTTSTTSTASSPSTSNSVPSDPADQTMFVLYYVTNLSLRLLHPYMPYITETLFQLLPSQQGSVDSLMLETWPTYDHAYVDDPSSSSSSSSPAISLPKDPSSITKFLQIQSLIKTIRNLRAEYQVEMNQKIPLILYASSEFIHEFQLELTAITFFSKIAENDLEVIIHERSSSTSSSTSSSSSEGSTTAVAAAAASSSLPRGEEALQAILSNKGQCIHIVIEDLIEIYIPQRKLFQREKELQRVTKQIEKITKDLSLLTTKLQNEKFISKAPKELIEETKNKVNELQSQYQTLQRSQQLLLEEKEE